MGIPMRRGRGSNTSASPAHTTAGPRTVGADGAAERYAGATSIPSRPLSVPSGTTRIGDDPEQPRYIQSQWGTGYRFVVPREGAGT